MPKWTNEQKLAIEKDNTNIIVSAGAGSGKTAVLTERVINKLLKGIKINELIILTFTNAAAKEMKDRIRAKISNYPEIKDNLNYLDIAPITTFDSYALSLVKKYHYLLNVSSNVNIVDDSIISIIKNDYLDEVFNDKYREKDSKFIKLINDFTIKNDTALKKSFLTIINKLSLKSDLDSYLDNYINTYLNDNKIDEYILEYTNLIYKEIDNIHDNLLLLEDSSYSDYYTSIVNSLDKLINSKTYDEIRISIPSKLPNRPRNSDDIKEYKDNIDNSLKIIKSYLRFNNINDIKESFNITKDYLESIIDIIKRFNNKLNEYKINNDLYEFNDIELMAIKLLKENKEIRDEIKYNTKEILVDEYQDTNDIQEEFINLISNNNIYMVGDIKQSIYGFRNANPNIFKNKYDSYSNNNNGIKIDLLHNFRSRSEVLDSINKIFSLIMTEDIGGADYKNSHQMIFGNNSYLENRTNENYNLEILNYNYEDKLFSPEEIEAFIIAKDIKNKINNKYQVYDKKLRDVTYKDFCIIMDRGSSFPLFKKVFEYLNIPLTIYEDKELTSEVDIMLINNIIGLILKISNNNIDQDYKYYFISIMRSYLFSYDDNKIFDIISNNSYKDTSIYKKCINIINKLDYLNSYELLLNIIDEFDFYKNTIKVGNIDDSIIRINNLLDISKNLSKLGYTINDFKEYLDKMINSKSEIKYKDVLMNSDSVKIMNIHKSKGLEFPICYYSLLHKSFNKDDIKDDFIYDNKYGIIIPYYDNGVRDTILKDLVKNRYNIDYISERLRLLYVALTRAKEKIIVVASLDEEKKNPLKYNSFLDIFNSVSNNLDEYVNNINLDHVGVTKDYLYGNAKSKIESLTDTKIKYNILEKDNEIIDNKHASVVINKLIDNDTYSKLKYGTDIHKIFEYEDFLTSSNVYIKNLVKTFNINSNTKIYKEHEFVMDNIHGIIDLILIDDNNIKIVDYKLKDINIDKYKEQLNIYYNYVNKVLNKDNDKKIRVYLYSIMDERIEEVL